MKPEHIEGCPDNEGYSGWCICDPVKPKQKCKACGGLGYVTNGFYPNRPCPFCRSWLSHLKYKIYLWWFNVKTKFSFLDKDNE